MYINEKGKLGAIVYLGIFFSLLHLEKFARFHHMCIPNLQCIFFSVVFPVF
jgi:hypothetical protein